MKVLTDDDGRRRAYHPIGSSGAFGTGELKNQSIFLFNLVFPSQSAVYQGALCVDIKV